jgi:hypothetical protein
MGKNSRRPRAVLRKAQRQGRIELVLMEHEKTGTLAHGALPPKEAPAEDLAMWEKVLRPGEGPSEG